jgi:glucose/mannose-6-phosphate isomerase
LLTSKILEKFDTLNMHKIYDQWPEMAQKSYNLEFEPINFDNIEHIIFSGMGGSGILGDVFSSIMSQTDIFVTVNKGYHLPRIVNNRTLVVSTSISGNTIETMSFLRSAQNLGCKTISFAGGGQMKDYCLKNNMPFYSIPMIHSPRSSFIQFLYSMIKILNPILKVKKEDIINSLLDLEKTFNQISSKNLTESNSSLNLASWITGTPLIYYPWGLQSTAIRFKNSIQENSKRHAMVEDVIESCHNCIMAWEESSNVQPILLQGVDDFIKTKERWKVLKEYFRENGINFYEIFSIKGSILTKIINLIYFLDYSSIYLSVMSEKDPSPIRSIDFIKKRISTE